MRFLLSLLTSLAALPAVASAATILVYVEETAEAASVDDPRPVRDGLLGGLFDRGHIVFDPGEATIDDVAWSAGDSRTLRSIAVEGGASILVLVRSSIRSVSRDEGVKHAEATLDYFVLDVSEAKGRRLASGELVASNEGKEGEIGAAGVAHGIGADLAATIHAIIASQPD